MPSSSEDWYGSLFKLMFSDVSCDKTTECLTMLSVDSLTVLLPDYAENFAFDGSAFYKRRDKRV